MSWISDYLKNHLIYQMADHSAVRIVTRYNEKLNKFFIDSKAGLFTYKPKDLNDMTRFRNKWINKFEVLKEKENSGDRVDKELFALCSEILKSEPKVSYEANLNTRLKKRLWNFKKLF